MPDPDALASSDLPPLLFTKDLADLLGIRPSAVAKALNRGALGPFGRLGRRLFVRRESLLAALRASEVRVEVAGKTR